MFAFSDWPGENISRFFSFCFFFFCRSDEPPGQQSGSCEFNQKVVFSQEGFLFASKNALET